MNVSNFPRPEFKLRVADGWYVVVTNLKNVVKRIITSSMYEEKSAADMTAALGFIHAKEDGTTVHIDVNRALTDLRLAVPVIRRLGYSIFFCECKNNMFKTDSACMYRGLLAGGL